MHHLSVYSTARFPFDDNDPDPVDYCNGQEIAAVNVDEGEGIDVSCFPGFKAQFLVVMLKPPPQLNMDALLTLCEVEVYT